MKRPLGSGPPEAGTREAEEPRPGKARDARRYESPRILSVEPIESVAAACAATNPTGPGKAFPTLCTLPGS